MSEGPSRGELIDKVIKIKRCAAVVKGGRRFSFAAMVVVGNGNGKVGWGYGKANEVPPSVEKAVKDGSRSMVEVALDEGTIPHQVEGRYGAARVVLVPAAPGTGVIAGNAVRGNHQYPHQELRLEQSHQPGQGDDGRARATTHPARS